ncbi:unnamed protein product [Albugo candida]|uniref:U2A'/phosphoprotein 32 family A C-terminal domain-containing protein n=1 Tax=Albugo candida TaxID=65357 RepID=A0A024G9N2_9STRA|nr:unnamed protein product [Albugo candida]|eukprot:CCI43364.1 unnamed protein product [Albugo candida]
MNNSKKSERAITRDLLLSATNLTLGKHESIDHFLGRITHLTLHGNNKKVIRKIDNLHFCPNLRVLYLYDNEIEKMENIDTASHLTHLYLQNNRINQIENLDKLIYLDKLYLNQNRISCVEGLENQCRLIELHLCDQELPNSQSISFEKSSIEALAHSLRVLTLANCKITDTSSLHLLVNLEQLDLSRNDVKGLQDVFQLLTACKSLQNLDLRHNPVTLGHKYREKVVTFSSSLLELLDEKEISSSQRKKMQSHAAHKYSKRQQRAFSNQKEPGLTAPKSLHEPQQFGVCGIPIKTLSSD